MTYRSLRRPPSCQRGQYLISALLALAVFALVLAGWATLERRRSVRNFAQTQGAALAQWAVGLHGFMANVQGGTGTLPSNPYTFVGIQELKPPDCGGLAGNPSQGYVPCAYTGGPSGRHFKTVVTQDPATDNITARIDFWARPPNGTAQGSAATLAAAIADAALAQQKVPTGEFMAVFANAPLNANSPPNPDSISAPNRGRVVMVVSNAPSQDIWLRVDGSNQMLADLDMGGHSIANAKNGTFSGSGDFGADLRVHGVAQVDGGLVVTGGPGDFRDGLTANDMTIASIDHTASQGIYTALVEHGKVAYNVPKPPCPAGETPAIYTSMQSTGSASVNGGDALYGSRVVVLNEGSFWSVQPQQRTASFSLSETQNGSTATVTLHKNVSGFVASNQPIVVVMTKCR